MVLRRGFLVVLLGLAPGLVAPTAAEAADPAAGGQTIAAPGWLGIAMETQGSLDGVTVKHVVRSSPADKGGLKASDRILKVDGAAVTGANQVTRMVSTRGALAQVVLSVKRGDRDVELRPVLASRPSSDEILRMDHLGTFAQELTQVSPLTGAPSSIAKLRGRVVVVDFWASWCAPCRYVIPRLNQLQAKLGAQGLTVVGVTTDEPEIAASSALKLGIQYGVVVDDKGATSRAYGIGGLPTMFIVDKKGVIRHVEVGVNPEAWAQVDQLLAQLLAEPAPAPPAAPPAAPQKP